MSAQIQRAEALRILSSLRKGAAPAEFARELFVGQERWLDAAIVGMTEAAECNNFDVRFIRAKYGGGKTHLIRCLEQEARSIGWVTSYALLQHGKVELDKFHTLVAEISEKLILPTGERGLSSLLEGALSELAKEVGFDQDGSPSMAAYQAARRNMQVFSQRAGLGYQFFLALQVAMEAHLNHDVMHFQQVSHWLGGGVDILKVDPSQLQKSQGSKPSSASHVKLKPLGLGDAEALIRVLALLAKKAGFKGLFVAIDEVELIAGLRDQRRRNSFQTLRSMVDHNDVTFIPPATCLFLSATPQMFENSDMFPSYKALQDRIESLPSLDGKNRINYRTPVIDLDSTELDREALIALTQKICDVQRATGNEIPTGTKNKIEDLVSTIVRGNYVIARPRLLCRCIMDLLDGQLGENVSQELAKRTKEMQEEREAQIKGGTT
jgi:hypothetical protein